MAKIPHIKRKRRTKKIGEVRNGKKISKRRRNKKTKRNFIKIQNLIEIMKWEMII